MWARIKASPLLATIVIIVIVIAICWLVGLRFHASAGSGGANIGVEHTK